MRSLRGVILELPRVKSPPAQTSLSTAPEAVDCTTIFCLICRNALRRRGTTIAISAFLEDSGPMKFACGRLSAIVALCMLSAFTAADQASAAPVLLRDYR